MYQIINYKYPTSLLFHCPLPAYVEIVLYELFSSDSARDSGRMDSIKLPPLSDSKKSALLSTFEADTKGKE